MDYHCRMHEIHDTSLPMTPIFKTAQIRVIEQSHGTTGLMEKAGLAAATLAKELIADGRPVLVMAGPGNNGGDAFVAARLLKSDWHQVDVVFTGDTAKLPVDACAAHETWLAEGGKTLSAIPPQQEYGLIIDGLFGIGLTRELDARHAALVDAVNARNKMGTPVLALDIPSGLCADTGRVLGTAIFADHTLTFLGLKPGLCTLDGPDHAGVVHGTDLGVAIPSSQGWLVNAVPALPAPRRKNSHKGDFGSIGVLGGDTSMTGAALLAGRTALLTGAGRVYCGLLAENPPAVDTGQPELMLRGIDSLLELDHLTALVIGPGMGRSDQAESALLKAIHLPIPVVLDADALHLMTHHREIRLQWYSREQASLITPHPGEAAAMLECSVAEIQSDRIASALKLAATFNAITVLKGCGSVIATPDGRWFINASGNAGLSSAGMGDVLAGIIGALLAQGMEALDATLLGVYLHGAAADSLVADGVGPVGLTASEVALEARNLLNEIQRP
jgi:hydroxyethylthiazole kinase-like uncharacterized protein yjeF